MKGQTNRKRSKWTKYKSLFFDTCCPTSTSKKDSPVLLSWVRWGCDSFWSELGTFFGSASYNQTEYNQQYSDHVTILTKGELVITDEQLCIPLSPIDMIFSFSLEGQLSNILRNSVVSCWRSSAVTVGSTYRNHSFFSVDNGISQLDHLQAKCMQKQATTVGLYWRHIVVRCKLRKSRINIEKVGFWQLSAPVASQKIWALC